MDINNIIVLVFEGREEKGSIIAHRFYFSLSFFLSSLNLKPDRIEEWGEESRLGKMGERGGNLLK